MSSMRLVQSAQPSPVGPDQGLEFPRKRFLDVDESALLDAQHDKSLSILGVLSRDNIARQNHLFRTIVRSDVRQNHNRKGGIRSIILSEKGAEEEMERFYQLSITETERFRKAAETEVSRFASENTRLRRELSAMVPQAHLANAQVTIARLTMDTRTLTAQLKEAEARSAAAAKEAEAQRALAAAAVRAQRHAETATAELRRRHAALEDGARTAEASRAAAAEQARVCASQHGDYVDAAQRLHEQAEAQRLRAAAPELEARSDSHA
jgi:hypothetical protein